MESGSSAPGTRPVNIVYLSGDAQPLQWGPDDRRFMVAAPASTQAGVAPAPVKPRLVSTNLRNARGTWVRLCPRWWFTGIDARQTSVEARRSGVRS